MDLHRHRGGRRIEELDVGGVPRAPEREDHEGHPLRDEVVEARHRLGGRLRRHSPRGGRSRRRLRRRVLRRRLHDEPSSRGRERRPGLDRIRLRRRAARPRARRAGAPSRATPLLLEERKMGARPEPRRSRRAGLLGGARLPQLRRSVAGAAVLGRLRAPVAWELCDVVELVEETPSTKTIFLTAPEWPGHLAGQHVDVRLTAEDGYQAQRSYSIASAPEDRRIAITVERLDDGEVSPYLAEELVVGDKLELRGPIGGYFVWDASQGGPVLLVGGGSGVVPLMAMIRHRFAVASDAPVRLLYSAKHGEDLIYRTELDALAARGDGFEKYFTLTREQPAGWHGYARRVDGEMLAEVGWDPAADPRAFVCGPTGFVEAVASALVESGHPPARVKTERFGPTG